MYSKSEKTKQFIVEQTASLFNQKGFAGTSLQDIMTATGLSKGGVYGNFEGKEAIALAVFDYNYALVKEHFKTQILATPNAVDRLLCYPHTYAQYERYPFMAAGCPILNTATEADDTHPALRARAASALDDWRCAIENQVKRGIARAEIKCNADPTQVAVIMISLIEGAFMQAKVTGRMDELCVAMRFLENFLENLRN
jgi:TetR/AcrR family transcriptional repressor of nem operon